MANQQLSHSIDGQDTASDTDLEAREIGQGRDRKTTLVRASDGQLAYPAYIPSTVHPPAGRNGTNHGNDQGTNKKKNGGIVIEGQPKPSTGTSGTKTDRGGDQRRPLASTKSWHPDVQSRRASFFRPPAPRAGISYLDRAIWEGSKRRNSNVSSRSSSLHQDEHGNQRGHTGSQTGEHQRFNVGNQNYQTTGKVKKDGRLRITVNETANTGYLAKALGAAMDRFAPGVDKHKSVPGTKTGDQVPVMGPHARLNIVIMVIGSRGDAQPFLKIGKVLKEDYGHRVRIATHPAFRDFVEKDSGLEFFSVSGDPGELMKFMVKNPGLIPTIDSIKAGDIGRRRAAMAEMFDGFWRACINATDDERDGRNLKMMGEKDPFVADAIIANPPSFAHIHCAEALGIPLHLMFTFPYTPTQAFPHPLASIKRSNVDPDYTNFISYPLVEMMVWQGLGDLVNNFRVKTLCLDPVSTIWAPGATYRLHVPFSYLWSPELVPKPSDWGDEIDISGFVFLDLASSFQPPLELESFLNRGEPPVYIGFGSIVVDDPDRFTLMIFEAVKKAGVRALVSKGWGGLGGDSVPDDVFLLDNTPHDWLFPRVKACVIHGGAGTTAIALKCGKPTMVVPFFGDQYFWGNMLGNAGVGPEPIPYKDLDSEKLAEGIRYCLTTNAQEAAEKMARAIENDGDGATNAVKQFHRQLGAGGPNRMNCSILRDRNAAWKLKNSPVRLSPLAADALVSSGLLSWRHLRLIRHVEWNDFEGPGEPVTGVAGSVAKTVGGAFTGVIGVPYTLVKRMRLRKRRRSKNPIPKSKREPSGSNSFSQRSQENFGKAAESASIHSSIAANKTADQLVNDVARGMGKTATVIAKAPADLSLALAQGFHNAPRLYGDSTVRRPPRVTGFYSGLRAARFEFAYGIYDGFTGVVRLPARGARDKGVVGFVRGVGMGLTGFLLKNLAALVGPVGYTLKGIVKQAERKKRPDRFIRRARIAQGQRELGAFPDQERNELLKHITQGWFVMNELNDTIANAKRQNGFAGRIDQMLLDFDSLFDDVDTARKGLEALRRGESLESILLPGPQGRTLGKSRSDGKRSISIRRSLNLPSRRSGEGSDRSSTEPKGQRDVAREHAQAAYKDRLTVPRG